MDPRLYEVFSSIDWSNSWPVFVLIVFASWFGAFGAAFFKKKAENLVTKSDFEHLLRQIEKTTDVTENIKAKLSEASWLNQQSWSIKEKYYTELLTQLQHFEEELASSLNGSSFKDLLKDSSKVTQEKITELLESSKPYIQKLRVLQAPAELVISDCLAIELNNLHFRIWEVELSSDFNDEDRVELILILQSDIQGVYRKLLEEAKKELHLIRK